MAKSYYQGVVVKQGRLSDYYAFHNRGARKDVKGKAIKPEKFSFTSDMVQAKNLKEAEQRLREKYPEYTIVDVAKIGS
jgi:hypothetical protein